MKKSNIFAAVAAAMALTASSASFAADDNMEHCKVTHGFIKAGKADCKTTSHSCAGQNAAKDADSWIAVEKGMCKKINEGDLDGVDQKIKDKLDMPVSK